MSKVKSTEEAINVLCKILREVEGYRYGEIASVVRFLKKQLLVKTN